MPLDSGSDDDESDSDIENKLTIAEEKYMTFELNRDIYSLLLITYMHQRVHRHIQAWRFLWPCCLCAVCMFAQYMCCKAGMRHVVDTMENTRWDPVSRALWELSKMNRTMQDDQVAEVCGEYQDFNAPDLATIALPAGTTGAPMQGYFFYAKMPMWTWSTKNLGDDVSILDGARIMLEEGYFGFRTGYAPLIILIFFMWSCGILVELRKLGHFLLVMSRLPMTGPEGGSVHIVENAGEGETELKWEVTHMTLPTKILGCFLACFQLFIAVNVGYTGFVWLRATTSKMDLILNSLALVFVLELDEIIFAATTSKAQIKFIDDLLPIKYVSVLPRKYLRFHQLVMPLSASLFAVLVTWWMRSGQIEDFSELFNAAAGACLFAGSRLSEAETVVSPAGYSPVPGMCESLLAINCLQPGAMPSNFLNGPCVITDFNFAAAKNVSCPSTESVWVSSVYEAPGAGGFSVWDWELSKDHNLAVKFAVKVGNDITHKLFRTCLAMYHANPTENRVTDRDTMISNAVADFHCNQDAATGLHPYFENLYYESNSPWLWEQMFGVGTSKVIFKMNILGEDEKVGKALGRCKLGE